ncbi:MAG: PIG-L family deacetylase [Patescibacteria group bacterium]|nr:PIG-L family deacetylase [Patescibacteria group bacterium]
MAKELIIAAHPDDEIIGCGGTMIKFLDNKHQVGVVYLSSGDSNEEAREKEAQEVCNLLNVEYYRFMRLKGPTFVADTSCVRSLFDIYQEFQPDFLFINHQDDGDHEHKIAYEMINQSFWRYNSNNPTHPIGGLAYYEVHKPMSRYQLVEVIDSQIERKLEALRLYKSQLAQSRLDKAIEGLNRYRGAMHEGCEYAEVFQLHKLRNLSDLIRI